QWKTKVACQGCAILRLILARKSPESSRVAQIVSTKMQVRNRSGKCGSLPTSNGYGTSHLRLYWSPLRTNCTTLVQFWRTTDRLERKFGLGSSEGANSSCGISTNSSRFTKRDARPGR